MLFANQEGMSEISMKRVLVDEETDFRRLLSIEDRKILQDVLTSKEYHYQQPWWLLSNLSVLEYWHPDWSTWYDVNPLVLSTIDPQISFSKDLTTRY